MRVVFGLVLAVALAPSVRAEVTVHVAAGRVDVTANAAPLADVLDRLARQTGMKVVYEGPAPRQLVTVSLLGRSPAEAVHDLLEGQGLNYALLGDSAGTGVQTLLMTGQASSVASSSGGSSASSAAATAFKPRSGVPPPMSSPDGVEEVEEEVEDEPEPATPVPGAPNVEGLPPGVNPGAQPPGAVPPGAVPPGMTPGAANPLLPLIPGLQPTGTPSPVPGAAPVQNAPAAPRTMAPTVPGFVPVNPLSPLGPFAPVIPANPGSPAGTPGSPTEPAEPKEPPL
jgi:hypothetical protein